MTDWPGRGRLRLTLSSCAANSIQAGIAGSGGIPPVASAVWPTANLGLFVPFTLHSPFYVTKLFWLNGTVVSGNVDLGIYQEHSITDQAATLLTETGSTAQAGTSAIQVVTLGTPIMLSAGNYSWCLASSTVVATFGRVALSQQTTQLIGGSGQQPTSIPMPATNSGIVGVGQGYWPICGMSNDPNL